MSTDEGQSGVRGVSLAWPGRLGAPVLDGPRATYVDVQPGVDLVVSALRTGYEQSLVIRTPQALARLAAGAGPVSWSLPVKTRGLTARAEPDGSVAFVDAKAVVVSRFAAPTAWDAAVDPASGEPASTSPVKVSVAQRGKGVAVLTLTPDREWLADPARVFPITIDPTYASKTVAARFDTFVQSNIAGVDQSAGSELKVGTYDGSTKARSYINFQLADVHALQVISASLSLYETWSYSCTARPVVAYAANPAYPSTDWAHQPVVNTTYSGTASFAKGFSSSCAAGRVSVPVTDIVSWWAGTSVTTAQSIQLRAANEADVYGWKRFASMETANAPYLSVTYNRKPNPAGAPTLAAPPAVSGVDPADGKTYVYTSEQKPVFSSTATDPDGNGYTITVEVHKNTAGDSSSYVTYCTSPRTPGAFTASGKAASCQMPALADNGLYYARAAVMDDQGLWNGTWSGWTVFRTAIAPPAAPKISCPEPYRDKSWQDALPAAGVVCTITAAGAGTTAPRSITYALDGATAVTKPITVSADPAVAKVTVTVPKSAGAHSLSAYDQSVTAVRSASTGYGFGYGPAGMSAPAASTRVTTTGSVKIVAAGPPKGASGKPEAKVRWRIASSGQDESTPFWNDATSTSLTVTDNGDAGVRVNGSWNAAAETADATLDADANPANGIQATVLNPRVPVLLDVQVCLTYSSGTQCTWSDQGSQASVMRLPHAFGAGFPVADAGGGQVALFTGEFNTQVTDASVPGYTGDLSLSRSHSTYGNHKDAPTDAVTGIFGPGWTASLEGSDAGLAGVQVVDSTRADGSIAFVDPDGTALVYLAPCRGKPCVSRRGGADLTADTYDPLGQDTELSGTTLTVAGTGAATKLTLTQDDGTVTVFSPETAAQAPGTGRDGVFTPKSVTEPGAGVTTYSRDGAGRVTRILAPTPPGTVTKTGRAVECADPVGTKPDGAAAELDPGCRGLRLTYGDGTAGTGNTPAGQVWKVSAELFNPAPLASKDCAGTALTIPAGMARVPVACYGYDAGKRLTSVLDPRTGLATTYGYGSDNQLTTVTPPGQAPTTLVYTTLEQRLKLTAVTRPQPAPLTGTANLAQIVYQVPTLGDGLPDLTKTATDRWAQAAVPSYGAAVFGPDYTGTISQVDGATPSASDWSFADLSYTDPAGYTVNTATFGAGAWQPTATDYDEAGNITRQLTAGAIAAITRNKVNEGLADLYATRTVYNPDLTDPAEATKVLTPAGTLVTDTYGPVRDVVLANGTTGPARAHTHTDYDQFAPNGGINPASGQPYRLATTITTTAANAAGADLTGETITRTTNEYGAVVPGTADGWALGAPTRVTTGGIATVTGYDTAGRTVATRQPASTGTDAGTTQVGYYTADGSATNPDCRHKPEWAGLPCTTGPAAAPSAGPDAPAGGAATLPTSWTKTYSPWLTPTTVVQTSGTATRTTSTGVDAAGRTTMSGTTATIPGSTSRPAVYTHYDPATGLVDYTGTGPKPAGSLEEADKTARYDGWGRQVAYRNDQGETTTTGYDAAGRVATVADPTGSTSTTWDGVDATGAVERRGLATAVTISRGGTGGALVFTGAYDPDGALSIQKLPGGITQSTGYDAAGQPTDRAYTGQVIPLTRRVDGSGAPVLDGAGKPVYDAGAPTPGTWLAWTQAGDTAGRVRAEYTGQGSSFDPSVSGATSLDQVVAPTGTATGYDRAYRYDGAGRLTQVADRTAAGTGTVLTPDSPPSGDAACTVRGYTFDGNGRRTALTAEQHQDGDCAGTPSTTTTTSYRYDTADRPTTGGNGAGTYTYDAFGRQTTVPAADAPDPARGNITLGYYDDDLPRAVTQNGVSTTFTLDSAGRRQDATTTGTPAGASTLTRHYTNGSDNPGWTVQTGPGGPVTTRYATSLGGDLAATINGDGTTALTLATLHGDVATTITIPGTQAGTTAATGIDNWSDYTEYGTPRDPAATTAVGGPTGYGWLGAKQRSTTTETAGLTLMGDRLYNPVTGRFTSCDPEPGGNPNTYTYPLDPINQYDLDGHWSRPKWLNWKNAGRAAGVAAFGACVFVSAGTCAVVGVAAAAVSARASAGRWRSTEFLKNWVVGSAFAVGGAGIGKGLGAVYKAGGLSRVVRKPAIRRPSIGRHRGFRVYHWSYYKANVGVGFVGIAGNNEASRRWLR